MIALPRAGYCQNNFLAADKIEYHEPEGYVEARGNVRIIVDKYTIYADRLTYDLNREEIYGYGNIRAFLEKKEVILGDSIWFHKKSYKILVSSFIQYFRQSDAILAARFAQRISKTHERLTDAAYTPCPSCKNHKPMWEISAHRVDVLEDQHKVAYKNAFFKVYGLPVAFFPYFSHPTPGAPPQSGILVPDISRRRVGVPLYWRPKSNLDLTLTPRVGKKGLLYEADLRHLLYNGSYRIKGSMTNSKVLVKNTDSNSVTSTTRRKRYNVSGDGSFRTDHFHYGFNVNSTSDKSYLKEYYNKDQPFLLSNAYVYKTKQSNFVHINNMHLQDLGANTTSSADPYVVPEINFRYVIPFENSYNTSFNLENYSSAYSTDSLGNVRRSIWSTSLTNSYTLKGHILGLELYNRSDLYQVSLSNDRNYTTGRTIPEMRVSWRYPWGGVIGDKQIVIEPITLLTLGRTHVPDQNKFGLLDTNSYDFSDTNFYQFNRYNGFDFHEYGRRVTYGLDSEVDMAPGFRGSAFLGQFQKLSKTAAQKSDIVGRFSLNLRENTELYYRFKKAPKNLKSNFDEVTFLHNYGRFRTKVSFVTLKKVPIPESTKNKISQLSFDNGYDINDRWNIGLGARLDLTSRHYKQLSNSMRVTYNGDCASISATVGRNFMQDSTRDIKKTQDWGMAISLKTLNM